MGNFKYLADKVLCRPAIKSASFLFPPLGKETGNLVPKYGNIAGNLPNDDTSKPYTPHRVLVETSEETIGKQPPILQETFDDNYGVKSFPSQSRNLNQLIDQFAGDASQSGIVLLWDDQRWLREILYGIPLLAASRLLQHYVVEWKAGAACQMLEHKRSNAGRYRANSYIRDTLSQRNIIH